MANTTISGLSTAATIANDADLLELEQGGSSKKVSARNLIRGLLLGAVSQSGGTPTGAVIERGSNANGEYVKFADGTQMLWGFFTQPVLSTGSYVITLPRSFVNIQYSMFGLLNGVSSGSNFGSMVVEAGALTTSTAFVKALVHRPTTISYPEEPRDGHYFAIGRWF